MPVTRIFDELASGGASQVPRRSLGVYQKLRGSVLRMLVGVART